MADYIEREALKRVLSTEKFCGGCPGLDEPGGGCAECVADYVADLPAADVAPMRIGFWIPIPESEITGWNPEFAGCDPITAYKCSRCGNEAIFNCNDVFVLSDYCPNCGAKMEVEHDKRGSD